VPIDGKALRRKFAAPWAGAPEKPPTAAFTAHVGRVSTGLPEPSFRTLEEACEAASKDEKDRRPVVVYLHDNGPLFETPALLSGRDLFVLPAEGYRPLLVWDVPRTVAERRARDKARKKKGAKEVRPLPLVFLGVRGGNLTLQGVEVAVRWPEGGSEAATLLEVEGGNLDVGACTFSAAGKHPEGLTLARFRGRPEGTGLCRFTRCLARGAGLVALDVAARGAGSQVLLDGCLIAGGEPPLLRVHAEAGRPVTLRVMRSTLVCGQTLLEVQGADPAPDKPVLKWEGWDALLSHSGNTLGGTLLHLRGPVEANWVSWQAWNCLYAGWSKLLTSKAGGKADDSAGDDLSGWQRRWRLREGDGVAREPWPDLGPGELASGPASTYKPAGGVVFASSVTAEKALGCDLGALPPGRDNWLTLAYEPIINPPEPLGEGVPAIPENAGGDSLYHGERLDLTNLDLGEYLEQVRTRFRRKFAPVVVLHLAGKGERGTSPIRIKGSSLVLYFEPPAKKEAPLVLKPAGSGDTEPEALIEVEGGSLDIIGGELRGAGALGPRVRGLVKVRGGNLRLYRCKLEGKSWCHSLASMTGSGETEADRKTHACTINESVLVCQKAGLSIRGVGARLVIRQTLLVAGTDALDLRPGPKSKGRTNITCLLENTTFAAGRAVLYLGDDPHAGVPTSPIYVQARDCAYLNPFPGKPARAGMLLYEGSALRRGLLLWQSERDTFHHRLHFSAALDGKIPDKAEGLDRWKKSLWGSHALRETPKANLVLTRLFPARAWLLERLNLKRGRGADLELLGVVKKPSPK
jgi:hypothetical protein